MAGKVTDEKALLVIAERQAANSANKQAGHGFVDSAMQKMSFEIVDAHISFGRHEHLVVLAFDVPAAMIKVAFFERCRLLFSARIAPENQQFGRCLAWICDAVNEVTRNNTDHVERKCRQRRGQLIAQTPKAAD